MVLRSGALHRFIADIFNHARSAGQVVPLCYETEAQTSTLDYHGWFTNASRPPFGITAFRAIMNGPAGSPPCFGLSAILRPVTHSIPNPDSRLASITLSMWTGPELFLYSFHFCVFLQHLRNVLRKCLFSLFCSPLIGFLELRPANAGYSFSLHAHKDI